MAIDLTGYLAAFPAIVPTLEQIARIMAAQKETTTEYCLCLD